MVNIGIVGTGFMTVQHLKAYRTLPGVRIAALCNPSGRHLDGDFSSVAGNVGDQDPVRLDMTRVRAYRDPAAMFADPEVQAVDICTPTHTHVALSLAALAAGRHVLLEKPMARTHADALRIASAAEAAAARGVFLMPAMCIRFWPEYAWVRERIVSGEYGRVLDARFRRVASAPAWGHGHFLQGGASGGALLDLHVHDVDFIQHCFGRPASVVASGYSKVSGATDHVVALFQYPGGPTVSAEGSWGMADGFGFQMEFTVNFEKATVDYNLARGAEALKVAEGGATRVVSLGELDGYVGELKHFTESVASGTAPQRVTAREAASAIELCEAEEASIAGGGAVVRLGAPAGNG